MALEFKQTQEYLVFANSIKAKDTLNTYNVALKHYMRFYGISDIITLLRQDNKVLESNIIKYILDMRQRIPPISHSLRCIRLAALKHFLVMNDVVLNWKKISLYLGEKTKVVKDRAYTTDEIASLLKSCTDERMRAVILLLASTGVRVGAIPSLTLKHLQKLEEYSLYQVTVYENTNDEYFCFTTPECASAIDSYLAYRSRSGEKLTPDSPLIREQFDPKDSLSIRRPRPLKRSTIMGLLSEIIAKSGVQTIKHRTEISDRGRERKETARAHAFRKFATTNMVRAKVNPEIREMLLGHSIGLSNSYYRPDVTELLEEYLKAIDYLIISNENRLTKKVQQLTIRSDKLDELHDEVKHLRAKSERFDRFLAKTDELQKTIDEVNKRLGL
jgi:integrase